MAVLSKIRERSILLIGIIGFCLLAFIVGDIINSGGFGITKNVGSVNGTDIPANEFRKELEGRQGASTTQVANGIWEREVQSILYSERVEKAGIRVGRDHVINIYGQEYGQYPQFMNALGQFDKAKFNEFLVNMKKDNPDMYQSFEASRPKVEAAAKRQVYVNMVKGGFFTTDLEGKERYALDNDKVSFDYVYVPYNTVNDDQVKVSDEELVAYMKENGKKYKSEPTRDIEYVLFENKPSAEDEAQSKKEIEDLLVAKPRYNKETGATDTLSGFATIPAAEVAQFVKDNTDAEIPYDTAYVTKAQLPAQFSEQIYNTPVGQVFGPYKDNGFYKLTRVTGKKAGLSTKVQHVLVAYKGGERANPSITRTKEEAKTIADGYLAQVNANASAIETLARSNSDDPGAVQNGGIYDITADGAWAKAFKDFAVNSPKGKAAVVETEFGYHVIKVLDKEDGIQVATVARKIQPSEKTVNDSFNKATKLEMTAREGKKKFAEIAKEGGFTATPANGLKSYDESIQGIGALRNLVRWAWNDDTKVGDVSIFDTQNGGRVVARLKNINDNGLLSIEEAKVQVLPLVRNKKKAEIIRKKMAGNTLEEVSKASGSSVVPANGLSLTNPMIPGVGMEVKVVGKAFGLAAGKTSKLIDGDNGVYMVRTRTVEKAAALPNYTSLIKGMTTQARGGAEQRLTKAMKDAADIEDNRYEFN
jgi:peptidyl-prolyl cis-trans isomerase D